ncbi:hypothetical protein [Demequina iriomotensis]|uniref:hypothetical protein n=1 Tax=Demequina iriomotensis TaxID=1536641 RepID=UPI0007817C0E|nr:hypothetical protein [Demequina iriomotensis]
MSVAPTAHGVPDVTDLRHGVRDSLREVADRFAAGRSRRHERRAWRRASRMPAADVIMRNLGDSFQMPLHARLL